MLNLLLLAEKQERVMKSVVGRFDGSDKGIVTRAEFERALNAEDIDQEERDDIKARAYARWDKDGGITQGELREMAATWSEMFD